MSIDTKALDNAADTFSRSMRALNSMELADLPPELDQDARDIARIIQDHGKGYEGTEYGDMTAPLLESLARLVEAAKAADRLAALEAELVAANQKIADLRAVCNVNGDWTLKVSQLEQDNARLREHLSNLILTAIRFVPDGENHPQIILVKRALAAGGDQ